MSEEAKARSLAHRLRRVHRLRTMACLADADDAAAEFSAQAEVVYGEFAALGWSRHEADRLVEELPE